MKRSFINILVLAAFFLTGILLICNYTYPFRTVEGGGWSVGYKYIDSPLSKIQPDKDKIFSFKTLDSITSHKTNFLADPFLIVEEGVFYLFFEEQGMGNANIALLESGDGVNYFYKGVVLDEDFHLSFPQVFKYRNEYYMLPETKGAGNVILYKATNFPYEWAPEDTLVKNVSLKDPAVLLSAGLNLITASDDNLRQYLFTADSLHGDWKMVKNFKRLGDETRAAGNFFQFHNNWYLPFQNTTKGYGTGVSLYQLNVLEGDFRFQKIINKQLQSQESIEWFNRGMHHLNIQEHETGYLAVYDGDILTEKKIWNWKASLKYNFYDLLKFLKILRQ